MTRRAYILLSVALSFMFLFMMIGYASFTDDLGITGSAVVEIPEGLFITEISTGTTDNVDHNSVSFISYTTTVDTTIDKKDDKTTTSSGGGWRPPWGGGGTTTTTTYVGSVTYEVTVFNNTKHEYAYRGLFYQKSLSGYNGNGYVSTSNSDARIGVVTNFPDGKVVGPGETLKFNVTYSVGKGMDDGTDWKTLINFQFGINVESEEAARDAIHEKFLNILNTSATYQELVDKIDDKYDGYNEWTSNYIGNVSSAVDADSMTVETLFAGQLQMVINGQVTPATVLIKHENLDNNRSTGDDYVATNKDGKGQPFYGYGCEMTLYLTTDPLSKANSDAPVYVTVFTCDRDENGNRIGNWYMIGDSYYGRAPIVGYNGEGGGTGSFVTDNWTAYSQTYSPTEEFSYYVAGGTTIKDLTRVVDQNAINEFQRILTESKEIIDDLRYAGIGIEMIIRDYEDVSRYYTLDENGNPIANSNTTRAQLLPAIIKLNHALTEAKDAIEALPTQLLE